MLSGRAGRSVSSHGVVGDDITLDDLTADPHPHLARLRAVAPVAWVPAIGGWLVTGRAAAVEVLRDPVTFTVDDPRFSTARVVGPSMLSTDGVEHGRHRDPYVAEFRKRAVTSRFGPFVAGVAAAAGRRAGPAGRPADRRWRRRWRRRPSPRRSASTATTGPPSSACIGWYREIVASVSGIAAGAGADRSGSDGDGRAGGGRPCGRGSAAPG